MAASVPSRKLHHDHDRPFDHNNAHVNDLRANHLNVTRSVCAGLPAPIQEGPLWQTCQGLVRSRRSPEARAMQVQKRLKPAWELDPIDDTDLWIATM
jgi:hypothetical protein